MSFRTKPWWFLCLLIKPRQNVLNSDRWHGCAMWWCKSWEGHPCQDLSGSKLGSPSPTSKRSFKAVCQLQWLPKMIFVIHHFGPSDSGHFFLEPREKCSLKIQHFWGEIGYSPSFRWILTDAMPQMESWPPGLSRSRSPRLFPSPWPTCVCRIPHCIAESPEFFQFKTLQNRLEMGSNRRSCDLFSKEIMQSLYRWRIRMSFAQHVGWNTAPVSILRCKPRIFTQLGWREHPKQISNCQVESPLDFHSHSAAFSFTTLNLCSLRRPRAAQS